MTDQTSTVYGGFWIRFLAYLVDSVVLFCALILLGVVFAFLGPVGAWLIMAAGLLGPLLYWGVMQASARQATFGKALLGMKVTDASGRRLSLPRSLGRELAKYVSAIPLMIGFLIAAFTGRKQALHDLVASTIVVKESPGHLVAALVIGVFGWLAPAAIVMVLGAGVLAGMMGILGGSMMEQLKTEMKEQQAVQSAPVQKPQPAAPTVTAAPPAAQPPAAADPLPGVPLAGTGEPGTTRAGPAILKLDTMFGDSFWIKTYLPPLQDYEGNSASLVLSHVVDGSGAELYDPANSLETEFFQRVSLTPESSPEKRLGGTRKVSLKSGASTTNLQRVEGSLKLTLPVKPLSASFGGADVGKQQTVHGVGITLKEFKGNAATFEFQGDHARVVSANGIGSDQKPVRQTGWGGGGGSMSYNFSAPVARVEVLVAQSLAQHAFPFTLTRTSVAGAPAAAVTPAAAAPAAAAPPAAPEPAAASRETAAAVPKPMPSGAEKQAAAKPAAPAAAPAPTVPAARQAPAPQAAARTQPPAVVLAAAKDAPPPAKPARSAPRNPPPDADARKCLVHTDDRAVIRCAEAYR